MSEVVAFPRRTYVARSFRLGVSGLAITMSGTLDGGIDFAVQAVGVPGLTYSLCCDDGRQIIAALHGVIDDIQHNCLFDRDPLLVG